MIEMAQNRPRKWLNEVDMKKEIPYLREKEDYLFFPSIS